MVWRITLTTLGDLLECDCFYLCMCVNCLMGVLPMICDLTKLESRSTNIFSHLPCGCYPFLDYVALSILFIVLPIEGEDLVPVKCI